MKQFLCLAILATCAIFLSASAFVSAQQDNPIINAAKAKLADTKKPFTLVVIVNIQDGKGKDLEAAFRPAQKLTRKEAGCLAYDLNRDLEEATRYYVYERWQNLEALEKHVASDHFKALVEQVGPMLTGTPEFKFFAIAD